MSIPSVEASPEQWAKVGRAVRDRRNALGLTIGQAVSKAGAGIQQTTWSKLENAQQTSYSSRALFAVCRALEWTSDSIERVMTGGEAVVHDDTTRAEEISRTNWQVEGAARDVAAQLEALPAELRLHRAEMTQLRARLEELEARLALLEGHRAPARRGPLGG